MSDQMRGYRPELWDWETNGVAEGALTPVGSDQP
jgi:hypothetical protein